MSANLPDARVTRSTTARIGSYFRGASYIVKEEFLRVVRAIVLLGAAAYGVHACNACQNEYKAKENARCAALNLKLPRVGRIVREGHAFHAYVDDPATKRLSTYTFPSVHNAGVELWTDVPKGEDLWIVSTVQMKRRQCEQRVEIHIRTSRDIE